MSLESVLEDTIRATVREVLREELAELRSELKPPKRVVSELKYLSPEEAGEIASVTADTIRQWVKENRLTRYAAGRHVRVKLEDLEALMRSGPDSDPTDAELEARAGAIVRRRMK